METSHFMKLYFLIVNCFVISLLSAQEKPVFEKAQYVHQGKTLHYRILKPIDFDPSQQYPLHLFLHGAGERGSDNEAQLAHGSSLFIEQSAKFPAIVIFPQCPEDDYWAQTSYSRNEQTSENQFVFPESSSPGWAMDAVIALLQTQLQENYIDKHRIYLSGLSMGGMGTFELLARQPDVFAAATPICGGTNIQNIKTWAHNLPLWIFHGDEDNVVPARYSKVVVEALIRQGIEPRFSLYPGVGHNSWDNAFSEPDLFSWIYNHRKSQ